MGSAIGIGWKEFVATWQNHWNQTQYDIGLNILMCHSSYDGSNNTIPYYHIRIDGKNGSYTLTRCYKIVEVNPDANVYAINKDLIYGNRLGVNNFEVREAYTPQDKYVHVEFGYPRRTFDQVLHFPFEFGIDSNGNYGYKKVGADAVTPFLSPLRIAFQHEHGIPSNISNELTYQKIKAVGTASEFFVLVPNGPLTTIPVENTYCLIAETTGDNKNTIYVNRVNTDRTLPESVKNMKNMFKDCSLFHFYVMQNHGTVYVYGFGRENDKILYHCLMYMPAKAHIVSGSNNLSTAESFCFL